jgi:hypothetical protein
MQGNLKTEYNIAALGLCDADATQEYTQVYKNLVDSPMKQLGDEARQAAAKAATVVDPLIRLKAGLITSLDFKQILMSRGSDDLVLVCSQIQLQFSMIMDK